MPDISMCNGVRISLEDPHYVCPMRDNCYRYMAEPSEFRQSFFIGAPFIIEPDGTSCEYFWKNEE